MKIVITVILVALLLWVIICCCRRAYLNDNRFKILINSAPIRDNVRFTVERFHGSKKAVDRIKKKYRLSERMALRLIHRVSKRPLWQSPK